MHNQGRDEHQFALAFLRSLVELFEIRSVLDIGSGTGRGLLGLKAAFPGLRVVGIEPSKELREVGYGKGLSRTELVDGDAQALPFADGEFDLVSEFAALHHIPKPRRAVAEMLRVSAVGIFLSDGNNWGQGSAAARAVKRLLRGFGLWGVFNSLRTKGKGYLISEGDGLFYPYSVFDDYPQIRRACASIHFLNTVDAGPDLLGSAGQVALLGLKKKLLVSS